MDSFFSGIGELVFFSVIQNYLEHEANWFMNDILGNVYALFLGFMLIAGKVVAIATVAGVVGMGGSTLLNTLTTGLGETITYAITGNSSSDPYQEIDKNLKLMQGGLSAMKAIDTGDNEAVESERTQALWMSGLGTAGPAIAVGTMLYKWS